MATGTHSEDESRIREGFICPICMEDLVTDDRDPLAAIRHDGNKLLGRRFQNRSQ